MTGKFGVCVLVFWALIVVVPDFARVFGTFNKLDVQSDNDGRLSSLGVGNDRQELDLWIDVKRTAWPDLMVMFGGLGGVQYFDPNLKTVTLWVRNEQDGKDAPSSPQTYQSRPGPLNALGRVMLALDQVFGVLFVLCGAVLVWRRPGLMTWGFFLYAIWFNPGQNYVLYAELQRSPLLALTQEFLQGIAEAVGYCGFVVFALRFPDDKIESHWRRIERALPLVALLLIGLRLWSFLSVFGFKTERITIATYGLGVAIDVMVIAILLIRRFKIDSPAERKKTRLVFWGCLVGLAAFIFADSNATTQAWRWMWSPSETTLNAIYLVNAVMPVSVYYAITRYRVVNVSFALSRKLTRTLLWFIAGIVVVYVHGQAEYLLKVFWDQFTDAPGQAYAVVISLTLTTLVLLKIAIDWLHKKLFRLVEHIFFRRFIEAQARLAASGSELESAESDEKIDRHLVCEPVQVFNLASAALFRRSDSGAYRRTVPSHGWPNSAATELSPNHALIVPNLAHGKAGPRPVRWTNELAKIMPKDMAFPSMAIPVSDEKELIGIVLYGAHAEGDDINEDELKALNKFARAAAAAYRYVELKRLRRRVTELEAEI